MLKIKKISLVVMIVFYAVAGANHFYNPPSYYKIIPHYIAYPTLVNILSGLFELLFAAMLISVSTRRIAAWGIILMMIAFLPVHIQMVIDAPFILGKSTVISPAVAWIRLVIFQPLLILWAWWYTRPERV